VADAPSSAVYLLTGSDRPKIATALGRLRGHFAPEAIEAVSALDTSGEAVVALCNAGSLFGDARLVVVEDVDGRRDSDRRLKGGWKAADIAAISSYVGDPAPGTVLALVGEDVKKTTALWKACTKAGDVLEYSVPNKEIQSWIAMKFRERGVNAEPEACALLLQLVGEKDLHALSAEIEKLSTWAAGEPIGEREVELLTAPAADVPIFKLTDAWAARDPARTLEASETIFERESKTRRDTAARLAGALGSHLSRLGSIKRVAAEGLRSKEAAERLGMNAYYVRNLYGQAETFSHEELRDATLRLAELDGALKGQSKLAPDLEIQRALVDLTRPPSAQTGIR
jgi:DNA polymerase III subunit delta